MILVNAIGDACPIPVVKTKKAIQSLDGSGAVQTLVDNEIAVQNLTKMANQKGWGVSSEKQSDGSYSVVITVGDAEGDAPVCLECTDKNTIVVISSSYMGTGDDALGAALMKSFVFALTQQDVLPSCILFYNGGAKLTCESSPMIDDLKQLQSRGTEILTCGTCLNHYGLSDKLLVGNVTNMYEIVEKMSLAGNIIKP